jgi:cysteine-rich repeat protein
MISQSSSTNAHYTPWRHARRILHGSLFAVALLFWSAVAGALPPGFVEQQIGSGWNEVAGLEFSSDGSRLYVVERGGKVWIVDTATGVTDPTPFMDISAPVGGWRDFGLLGFALHPNFESNGFVYVLFVLDRYWFFNHDQPGYDPGQLESQQFQATFGRISRFTADPATNRRTILPGSEVVFVGETPEDGIPILHQSHGTGQLAFGEDGTLLASNGDGASYSSTDLGSAGETYWSQGLTDGIIEPWENIGAYRAQMTQSYNGNVLRLAPYTGAGVSSNPWFDPADPKSVQSRSFAVGLRNPYRFSRRPGTGSVDPTDGAPGTFYIGDVGWNNSEDLHVLSQAGQNFGWPAFEGMFTRGDGYWGASIDHAFAKNPLFGVSGCSQEYFHLYNLIVQDTLNTPSWPNPCDAGQQIPDQWVDPADSTAYIYRKFEHSRPSIAWRSRSWVATYDGSGEADTARVGDPGSPVSGTDFSGNASTGGTWYTGSDFPLQWRDSYFHADYGGGWIKSFGFDGDDVPFDVVDFVDPGQAVTFVDTNPATGGIYYVKWATEVREIRYVGVADGSTPPIAIASIDSPIGGYGPEPLSVDFRGSDSSDIDPGDSITYFWEFGDGNDSPEADPTHVYDPGDGQPAYYSVHLTVSDENSNLDEDSLIVSVNNTPPSANITLPVDGSLYDMVSPTLVDLDVNTSDLEHSAGELSCSWLVEHVHNDHTHPLPGIAGCSAQATVTPQGCDGNAHSWRFSVTVSDAAYLSTTTSVAMQADCSTLPGTPPLALDDYAAVAQGYSVDIEVTSNDYDIDGSLDLTSVTEVTPPSHGSILIDPVSGIITYSHDASNNLVDQFSYRVSDDSGDASNVATVFLTAFNNPPAVSIISPVDQSRYEDGQMLLFEAQGSDPEDGSAVSYDWEVQLLRDDQLVPGIYNFSGEMPPLFETGVHGQPASGVSYLVRATVTDLTGATASAQVRVNPASPPAGNTAPFGSFTATPGSGVAPLAVDFDASGSFDPDGDYITYDWDFGDGTDAVGITPSHTYAVSGNYLVQLTVVDSSGASSLASVLVEASGTGIEGTYFNNWSENGGGTLDLSNPVLIRIDNDITFAWGNGSPDPVINNDNFAVRWEGQIQPLYSEDYQFYTYSDDGVRLWIDGVLVVDHWSPQGPTERTGPSISLTAGFWHDIVLEYFENGGGAVAELRWESASQVKQAVPQSQLAPPAAGNAGPAAVDDAASVEPSSSVLVAVLANDVDEDDEIDPTTVQVTSGPSYGSTLVDAVTGEISYTHGGATAASDSFTYTVEDLGQAISNEATVTVSINLGTPTISILSPSAAEQIPGHQIDVVYSIAADPLTYDHVHLTVDQPPYADETTPDGLHSFQSVAYGTHTLLVQLVDSNHQPLPNPESNAQVSFASIAEAVCGDGVAEQAEACDDGNTQDGDCCSATCSYEAAGGACTDDANECTTDTCNATGLCMHQSVPNGQLCSDGDACTTADTCGSGVCDGIALPDNDGDLVCDLIDSDDDDDGVDDLQDSDPFDPFLCGDVDLDSCEDCSSGVYDLINDGPDFDSDGICESELDVASARDNTLVEDLEGDVSNGAGEYFFAGVVANGSLRRGLLSFDVGAAIPAGSTVHDVILTLNMSRSIAGAETVGLHALQTDWGEADSDAPGQEGAGTLALPGDATWLYNFMGSSSWTTAGGDFAATASATQTVGPAQGDYTWSSPQMIVDVQSWLDDPSTDFGWLVLGDENSGMLSAQRFDSRENAIASNRPLLWIHYSASSQTAGGCCFADGSCGLHPSASSCTTQGGSYQGDATACIPNTCAVPVTHGDFDEDGDLDGDDALQMETWFTGPDGGPLTTEQAIGDFDGDDDIDCDDMALFNAAFTGPGQTSDLCQPVGACCAADGVCSEVTSSTCSAASGSYSGDLSVCSVDLCNVAFLEPYVDALPIPAVATPISGSAGETAVYQIAMTEFQQQLHRDLAATTLWGYGGTYPGPTIEAGVDENVAVEWVNDLRDGLGDPRTEHYLPVDLCPHGPNMFGDTPRAVVHLHGAHTKEEWDGYPEDTILPGESDIYHYPNHQLPATLWYHDHALGITRLNVYMGLAGFYLIRDDFEKSLGLPAGEYEIPLVIQDRSFNPDGSLHYPAQWQDMFFGDHNLVNGMVTPYLDVKQGKYRFRILNGANSRSYTLSLSSGVSFELIGTDGGLLQAPVSMTEITLTGAERADVIVDFSALPAGTEIVMTNSAPSPLTAAPGTNVTPDVMKFVVQAEAGFTGATPASLRPMTLHQEVDAVEERDFELAKAPDACTGSTWLINGLHWDDITERPELGTTEIWRFINRSGMVHPMHMHLVMFQVLDREPFTVVDDVVVPSGSPQPPAPHESGWKDTIPVYPGEIVRVIARFEDYTGKFAYHCHIIEHEDQEMMRQFEVVAPCGNGVMGPGEECDDGNTSDGDCCSSSCTLNPAGSPCTSDGESCTVDTCDGAGLCQYQALADGSSCDDSDQCTVPDECSSGLCVGIQLPDLDGDIVCDAYDDDDDGDGLSDSWESGFSSSPITADSDGDGARDGDEISLGSDPTVTTTPAPAPFKYEVGVAADVSSDSWTLVNLDDAYTSMVVVASAVYDDTQPPLVVRLQNAAGSQFELKLERADLLAGSISGIAVHFLVVEEGVYSEEIHGIRMEAAKFLSTITDNSGSWVGEIRTYAQSYSQPVVMGQVMSANDGFSSFWSGGSDPTSPPDAVLRLGKHVGQDTDQTRANENVGYLVVEAGAGRLAAQPFVAGISYVPVHSVTEVPPSRIWLSEFIEWIEAGVVSQSGMKGTSGSWGLLRAPMDPGSEWLEVATDEDQITDSDRGEALEDLAYLAFASSPAGMFWEEGSDATALPPGNSRSGALLTAVLGSFQTADDVDLYRLTITDPLNFSAATLGPEDASLFLFQVTGDGIAANSDDGGASSQAVLSAGDPLTLLLTPGHYTLGISQNGVVPTTAGTPLFATDLSGAAHAPLQAGSVDGWSGSSSGQPASYAINLSGAQFTEVIAVPEPSAAMLLISGSLGLAGLNWLRSRRQLKKIRGRK